VSVSPAPVSVVELQGALRAAWAGQFRGGERASQPVRRGRPLPVPVLAGRVVMVVGCHGGGGASTVALCVAQAAVESGRSVRLLDCASAERSGLVAAVDAELGVVPGGWRRGRRARLRIDRVVGVVGSAAEVPVPVDEPSATGQVTVVDAGWGATGVLSGDSWLARAAVSAAVVLVGRATIPGFRRFEQVLAACPPDPVVAVLGRARWDRSVSVTAGPRLLGAQGAGRVVRVRLDRHLGACGITCAPLPAAVRGAGRQIFAALAAAGPQTASAQDRMGSVVSPTSGNGPVHDLCNR
jgi:hypothetical protein